MGDGYRGQVPTDWQIFLDYELIHFSMFTKKVIKFKSWVEDLAESDVSKINNEWKPTSA